MMKLMKHVSLLTLSLGVKNSNAGLLGYGTGEGSCAAAPFRYKVKRIKLKNFSYCS